MGNYFWKSLTLCSAGEQVKKSSSVVPNNYKNFFLGIKILPSQSRILYISLKTIDGHRDTNLFLPFCEQYVKLSKVIISNYMSSFSHRHFMVLDNLLGQDCTEQIVFLSRWVVIYAIWPQCDRANK